MSRSCFDCVAALWAVSLFYKKKKKDFKIHVFVFFFQCLGINSCCDFVIRKKVWVLRLSRPVENHFFRGTVNPGDGCASVEIPVVQQFLKDSDRPVWHQQACSPHSKSLNPPPPPALSFSKSSPPATWLNAAMWLAS